MKMAKQHSLPFVIGQHAEARCFSTGFRGAWFRCKIKKIRLQGGYLLFVLEYYDFPGEKLSSMRVWQKSPLNGERVLMVRPSFPDVYPENKMPVVDMVSKTVVVTRGIWKVDDLVDWLSDYCFWSGKITEIMDDNRAKVQLHNPPVGEGSEYEVLCHDLRPSMYWTPELGWHVPAPLGAADDPCARVIQPVSQGLVPSPRSTMVSGEKKDVTVKDTKGHPSKIADVSKEVRKHSLETIMDIDVVDSDTGKTSYSDSVSSSYAKESSTQVPMLASAEENCDDESSEIMQSNESIPLNSNGSDTIEAAILDLEELVNKVKWLQRILEFGIPSLNPREASWKFLEHRTVSTSK